MGESEIELKVVLQKPAEFKHQRRGFVTQLTAQRDVTRYIYRFFRSVEGGRHRSGRRYAGRNSGIIQC
jgi:hypothetical protein